VGGGKQVGRSPRMARSEGTDGKRKAEKGNQVERNRDVINDRGNVEKERKRTRLLVEKNKGAEAKPESCQKNRGKGWGKSLRSSLKTPDKKGKSDGEEKKKLNY